METFSREYENAAAWLSHIAESSDAELHSRVHRLTEEAREHYQIALAELELHQMLHLAAGSGKQ